MVGLTIQEQEDYQKKKQNISSHDPATDEARSDYLPEKLIKPHCFHRQESWATIGYKNQLVRRA